MADTYEKDLAQKSSLTTSDFIRVVGSDNVSYKQGISSVMRTMNLTMNNQVTTSLEDYVASLPTDAHKFVWATGGDSATVGAPVSGVSTVYEIRKVNSSTAEIIADTMPRADQRRFIKKRYDNTWGSWVQMPTRAEVDALTPTTWQNATINSTYVSEGTVKYVKSGKLVFGAIQDMKFSSIPTGTGNNIATGLPPALSAVIFTIHSYRSASVVRVAVSGTNLFLHYPVASAITPSEQHYGFFMYVAS